MPCLFFCQLIFYTKEAVRRLSGKGKDPAREMVVDTFSFPPYNSQR